MQFLAHIILPTFKTDLRMCYQFVSWGLQKWQKMREMFDNKFVLTPCIICHFQLISKNIGNFFYGQFFLE